MAEGNAEGSKMAMWSFVTEALVIIQKWVHRKCSGIKSSMYKVMKTFVCRGCMNLVTGTGRTSVDNGVNVNLELVDKFCY